VFYWDTSGPWYNSLSGDDILLQPGLGYWIYSYVDCELFIQDFIMPEWDGNISTLAPGWNGLGIPTTETLTLGNLTINYSDVDYNWSDAISAGLVESSVFWWDTSGPWYQSISGVDAELVPAQGYWFYAYYDCTLKR